MTFLIGKQCTDGVLFIADGISIIEDPGPPATKVVTTGAVKAFGGKRGNDHYCIMFSGHAGLDTTLSTLEWLKGAATKPSGSLQDNVGIAAQEALRDAVENGFKSGEEAQQFRLRNDGRIIAFVSVCPNEWWCVDADYDDVKTTPPSPGFVVISPPSGNPDGMKELLILRNHQEMSLKNAVASCARVFDKASILFQEGCRYPGTVCVHRAEGYTMENFSSFDELNSISERWP